VAGLRQVNRSVPAGVWFMELGQNVQMAKGIVSTSVEELAVAKELIATNLIQSKVGQ